MSSTNNNKIIGFFKGLQINNNNTRFEMLENGTFSSIVNSNNLFSKNIISNISNGNSIYKSNGNLNLSCPKEDKVINIISGDNINNEKKFNLKEQITLFNVEDFENNDNYFDNITDNIFENNTDIFNLKNDSSLILESYNDKSIYLYSNNGIHNVSHNNINLISDKDILLQASNKLNFRSFGFITLNSEKFIANTEDDINLITSTGNIKFGGNGINEYGIKINSVDKHNYLSIGQGENSINNNIFDADRLLHLNINENSLSTSNKNGIIIDNRNKTDCYPDIEMNNYKLDDSNNFKNINKFNLGIGTSNNDFNNLVFITKLDNLIIIENNYQFTVDDIGYIIKFENDNLKNIEIQSLVNNSVARIINNQADFTNEKGFILKNNESYIKTNTESNLCIGTNKNNIININKIGNIGINNDNSECTLDVKTNYGIISNIRIEKDKKYLDSKTLFLGDNNFVLICKTELSNVINLELFLFNKKKKLIKNIIVDTNLTNVSFDLDNLKNYNNNFIIAYSYINSSGLTFTKTKIYSSKLEDLEISLTKQNDIDTLSNPVIRCYNLGSFDGYIIGFLDKDNLNNITSNFYINKNTDTNLSGNSILLNEQLDKDLDFSSDLVKIFKNFNIEIISSTSTSINVLICFTVLSNGKYFNKISKLNINDDKQVIYLGNLIDIFDNNTEKNLYTKGFDIKFIENNRFIISYYILQNNIITDIRYTQFDFISNDIVKNINILESGNTINYNITNYNNYYPSVSCDNTLSGTFRNFIISYVINNGDNKNIKYFFSNNSKTVDLDYENTNNGNLLELKSITGEYETTLLIFNSQKIDNFDKDSIILKEINSVKDFVNFNNILKITNLNKTIIKNTVLKNDNITSIDNLEGEIGELKIINNKDLYIYLRKNDSETENVWKKINLIDI